MSSRDHILRAIRQNRPGAVARPASPSFGRPAAALPALFSQMTEQIGGTVCETRTGEVADAIAKRYPEAQQTVSTSALVAGTLDASAITDPHDFADIDLFVCEGVLGVAENGAIWIPGAHLAHRALPFITQHLAIVLPRDALVWNLHEAYTRISVDAAGYGVFIAGPSKTADIEQSLVIGAHGARSLTVLLHG